MILPEVSRLSIVQYTRPQILTATGKCSAYCTLVGPWEVMFNVQKVELNALTCIGTASNLYVVCSFQRSLEILDICSTSKNPQSHAICEQMHHTIGNMLQTPTHESSTK
eukprot:CCRYP_008366-RA/>CCRYP_008366-RA protein AED:0.54 eAED:0.54 QI:0/0/0/1/0/0/2/0/108